MKRILLLLLMTLTMTWATAQTEQLDPKGGQEMKEAMASADSISDTESDSLDAVVDELGAQTDSLVAPVESAGMYKSLKTKFIEGNAGFMSLVALALVLGLAFCIERIIFLTLSEIKTRKFMSDVTRMVESGDIDGALQLSRNTRGPVAALCYQGLSRADAPIDEVERSVASYGTVQAAALEKGCSWITLFIAIAPSLGFLGTVIGMVMAFDQIQAAGDISPTIVAAGMKVALITTIFGIIAALVLQLFYNFILTRIERITADMEESAITLLDALVRRNQSRS
ncbi:MAG: MotA/TolQ/ExbB proton channel family protein [Prevotella sp.]|nr:MotA/TolQ/ExbB proton channel family protein [Prevotella sp.]